MGKRVQTSRLLPLILVGGALSIPLFAADPAANPIIAPSMTAPGMIAPSEIAPSTPAPAQSAAIQNEGLRLASGGELITLFEKLPADSAANSGHRELPLVSVLKDTLNDSDPANDRIRQVWVFTYSPPSIWQRIAGGIPFLYHRAGLDAGPGIRAPKAVIDLGDPAHGVWAGLALTAVQSEVLNPIGSLARLTTQSFFGNYGEYRRTHVLEAATALTEFPADFVSSRQTQPAGLDVAMDMDEEALLTPDELHAVEERLELSGTPLGGLVSSAYLQRAQNKQRARRVGNARA